MTCSINLKLRSTIMKELSEERSFQKWHHAETLCWIRAVINASTPLGRLHRSLTSNLFFQHVMIANLFRKFPSSSEYTVVVHKSWPFEGHFLWTTSYISCLKITLWCNSGLYISRKQHFKDPVLLSSADGHHIAYIDGYLTDKEVSARHWACDVIATLG